MPGLAQWAREQWATVAGNGGHNEPHTSWGPQSWTPWSHRAQSFLGLGWVGWGGNLDSSSCQLGSELLSCFLPFIVQSINLPYCQPPAFLTLSRWVLPWWPYLTWPFKALRIVSLSLCIFILNFHPIPKGPWIILFCSQACTQLIVAQCLRNSKCSKSNF